MGNIAEEALAADRLKRALDLRVKGAHWDEIAAECMYPSPAAALADVGRAMAAASQRATETADQMRDTANLRLEHLLRSTLGMLEEDAPETYDQDGNPLGSDDRAIRLRAVDEARRIVGDLAKLNGVDKPSPNEQDNALTVKVVGINPADIV